MIPESANDPELKKFIRKHKSDDPSELLLKGNIPKEWDKIWIAQQIEGYQKSKKKFPELHKSESLWFPRRLSIEQASSELTAKFKTGKFKGKKLLDLSGGMGIDMIYMNANFEECIYVEQDEDLCAIAEHNFRELGFKEKVKVVNTDAESFVKECEQTFDLIYLDPARRDNSGRKVFRFSDCSPNVIALLETLQEFSDKILVKAAPMLDISQGVRELRFVEEVFVLANSRECKEVLFLMGEEENTNPVIQAWQLESGSLFEFRPDDELLTDVGYGGIGKYLYNPGPAISKAGGFKYLSKNFKLRPVHPNTHLYFSDEINPEFPGRIHEVEAADVDIKTLKKDRRSFTIVLKNAKAEKKELIRKLKIREGNDAYLYYYQDTEGDYKIAVCSNPI